MKYSIEDVLEIAIQVEKTGHDFYLKLSEIFVDESIKSFCKGTAEQELIHMKFYQDMQKEFSVDVPTEEPDAEAIQEATNSVSISSEQIEEFQKNVFNKNMVKKFIRIEDIVGVLKILIEAEQAAIDLYSVLEISTAAKYRAKVKEIINEEKSHMKDLIFFRNKHERLLTNPE